jgi:sugar (pentulose or hexulose) kinase
MTPAHVAVIDIGKTNAKLALVDLGSLAEIAVMTRPNRVLPGPPYPHFDVEGHWRFLLDGLREMQARHGIDAISVTTHGACAAFLDGSGALATPVLDYEFPGPDDLAAGYDAIRPDFARTGSPRLPIGLNLGAQLYWLLETVPGLRERTSTLVTWPQYWSHRLTGVASSDVSSLGCHTDLWDPQRGSFSPLVERLGLVRRIAPARRAADVVGPVLAEVAAATGLRAGTPVVCGIHDSNASLLPHLLTREPPFTVVSTGTWVIVMAVGGRPVSLDPTRDTLVNVDAMGRPVHSARFMGGREFEMVAQEAFREPSEAEIAEVLARGPWLLPSVEPGSGPFQKLKGGWEGGEPAVGSPARNAALSFYLALMTAECMSLVGHAGTVVVEGAFARNRAYLGLLAAATGTPVEASPSATGTALGAALLLARTPPQLPRLPRTEPLDGGEYVRRWRVLVGQMRGGRSA